MKKAYLVLNNGKVFEGFRLGAEAEALGELVFTTGMVGYLETLTDPRFAGQIVIQTFPLAGNYGVIAADFEGKSAVSGYVVRECCAEPSNFRSEGDLNSFLLREGIPGICGVDTRELTRIIREEGVMSAMICSCVPEDLSSLGSYAVKNAVATVSRTEAQIFPADGEKKYSVALIDYGAARSLISALCSHGCEVTVLPHYTTAETVLAVSPDGVVLSGGPGDPAENVFCIKQIKKLIGRLPLLGIGLGHQMAALAMGGRTVKLRHGHRGANQPVSTADCAHTYITVQNHGYAVDASSLGSDAVQIFKNANDGTCEGLEYPGLSCFTVQFDPDGRGGNHSTAFVFDRFNDMMGGAVNA